MNTKFKLFNFKGIPVTFDILFLVLFILMPISIVASIFIAVLLHEMAHAYVANLKGYRVYGIEIGLFSGSAAVDTNIHERDSLYVVAAGPISNFILYSISLLLTTVINNPFLHEFANVNLFLFVFNILPIYPMDGGRLLNDYLLIKNRRIANRVTNRISLITSILLIIFSLIYGYLFMAIFGLMFVYMSLKKLKIINF